MRPLLMMSVGLTGSRAWANRGRGGSLPGRGPTSPDPDRELTPVERDALDLDGMQRILAGDGTGLADLYDRHARLALVVAMSVLRDQEDAEDVVHDAFLAVVERAHQFAPSRGSPISWLLVTVRNLAVDRVRRRVRRAQIVREDLRYEPHEPVPDPEACSSRERRCAEVRAWLASLTHAQRRTLETAFFEGLSYPEIAAREGVPLGTVKARASRGLMALRAVLGLEG